MLTDINANDDSDIFNNFIENMDLKFALCAFLGDHDDCFDEYFLSFIDKAWTIQNDL